MEVKTDIENFKLETAKQVAAAITEKRTDCFFTLLNFNDSDKTVYEHKKRILDKAEIILKSAGISTNLVVINFV